MRNLEGATALVTAAGGGIGREIALALARSGCHVLINDLVKEKAEGVVEEVRILGRNSESLVADVSDSSQMEAMCRKALRDWGGVDILVNNAGIYVVGRLMDIPIEEWERSINVNLWSHIQATQILLPEMIRKRRGHIVYISSGAALWGHGYVPSYVTTKFALSGFAEAIAAQAHLFKVGVSVVCPFYVRTGYVHSAHIYGGPTVEESVLTKGKWLNRWMSLKPEKVARKVLSAIRRDRFLVLTDFSMKCCKYGKFFFPQRFLRLNSKLTDWVLPLVESPKE